MCCHVQSLWRQKIQITYHSLKLIVVTISCALLCKRNIVAYFSLFPQHHLPDPMSFYCKGRKSINSDTVLVRSNITLERVLGEGQFGDVYKGAYRAPVRVCIFIKITNVDSANMLFGSTYVDSISLAVALKTYLNR